LSLGPRGRLVLFFHGGHSAAQPAPTQDPFLATLSAPTPTPHIPSNYESGANFIIKDGFTNNLNHNWYNHEYWTELAVGDGKLSFDSSDQDSYATAISTITGPFDQPVYIQADLSTDASTAESYGVLFDDHYPTNEFFVFQINPESKQYTLHHHIGRQWYLRMSGVTDLIKSYPAANTIGIYMNKGYLEFYINHGMIDVYQDSGSDFQSGQTGFYANNSGFHVVVTNFAINRTGAP